jgi:hypothetical protein
VKYHAKPLTQTILSTLEIFFEDQQVFIVIVLTHSLYISLINPVLLSTLKMTTNLVVTTVTINTTSKDEGNRSRREDRGI